MDRIEKLSPEQRRLLTLRLRAGKTAGSSIVPREDRNAPALLSHGQERIWFLESMYPGSPLYNIPSVQQLEWLVDPDLLGRAVSFVFQRHDILRTRFFNTPEGVRQLADVKHLPYTWENLAGLRPAERTERVRQEIARESAEPFDLVRGPAVRVRLLQLEVRSSLLLITMHHIISDARSLDIFFQELSDAYQQLAIGSQAKMRALPIQYADYAVWQRQSDLAGKLQQQLEYWRKQLSGAPVLLPLPTDRLRPPRQSFRGAMESFTWPSAWTGEVSELARSHRATSYIVLAAAFAVLLNRLCGVTDLVLGSPMSNRRHGDTEELIGYFINTLVLRHDLGGNPTFIEFLARSRSMILDAFDHQAVPLERILESLDLPRSMSFHPLFQVTFGLQTGISSATPAEGASAGNGSAKFDLTLVMAETSSGLSGTFEFNTDLFDPPTIRRLSGWYRKLVRSLLDEPHLRIGEVSWFESAENLSKKSGEPPLFSSLSNDDLFWDRFAAVVQKNRSGLAVETPTMSVSWGQLEVMADDFAGRLIAAGVKPQDRIAVLVPKGVEWVVAFLAALRSGAVFLPIDPEYPDSRIRFMLDESEAAFVVTSSETTDLAANFSTPVLQLSRNPTKSNGGEVEVRKTPRVVSSEDPAYLIYTSGSTGQPKGALLPHGGLRNLVDAQADWLRPAPKDRILAVGSIGFDASIFDLAMALASGATLCIANADQLIPGHPLTDTLKKLRATILVAPPSLLRALPVVPCPDLRLIVAAGELCPAELVNDWQPGRRFVNAYGPTECSIWASAFECKSGQAAPPIGRPVRGTTIAICDDYGNPVPLGIEGEIRISGRSVGLGYFGRPELTANRFLLPPDDPLARQYRTGDRGRLRADGEIEFLGRIDSQVKIRGFRIELGEIEAALARVGMSRSVVAVESHISGEEQVVAYVVPLANETSSESIRRDLRLLLPPFLIPNRIILIDRIPLTQHGKADLQALAKTIGSRSPTVVRQLSSTETRLAKIWSEILGVTEVRPDDDFFDLGGHSLLVARVVNAIRQEFGIDIALKTVFEDPTLAALATRFADAPSVGDLPAIRRVTRRELSELGSSGGTGS